MINLGLGNFYGEVLALEEDGKFYLELDDWNNAKRVEISEEHFRLIEKEYGKND